MTWSQARSTNSRRRVVLGLLGALVCFGTIPGRAQNSADQLYQRAHDAYVNGRMEEACDLFRQLASVSPNFSDSESLRNSSCGTAKAMHDKEDELFKKGVQLYTQGNYAEAKTWFEKARGIPLKTPAHRDEIARYLNEITKQEAGPVTPHPKVPPKEPPKKEAPAMDTAEQTKQLEDGLRAYFAGDFEGAGRQLSDYLKNGHKQGLALFFLGASHSTLYFLSGEKDNHQRDLAVENFSDVKEKSPQFQPPDKYVSPKIIALYNEATHAGN